MVEKYSESLGRPVESWGGSHLQLTSAAFSVRNSRVHKKHCQLVPANSCHTPGCACSSVTETGTERIVLKGIQAGDSNGKEDDYPFVSGGPCNQRWRGQKLVRQACLHSRSDPGQCISIVVEYVWPVESLDPTLYEDDFQEVPETHILSRDSYLPSNKGCASHLPGNSNCQYSPVCSTLYYETRSESYNQLWFQATSVSSLVRHTELDWTTPSPWSKVYIA